MLKLFVNQWKIPAMLFRNCSPAVVSSSLRSTHKLKVLSRPISDVVRGMGRSNGQVTLASEGKFHLMSLTSKKGDSLLEMVKIMGHEVPSFRCTGMYDEEASLVNMVDSTQFLPNSRKCVSFSMTLEGASYYLSLSDGKVVARDLKDVSNQMTERERFVRLIHGTFSMFESVAHRDYFLGSYQNRSLHLIKVYDKLFPDPRTLFLMHSKLIIIKSSPK